MSRGQVQVATRLLQTHRYWPGGELSDRLEVSPRTLRRDIDRLRELG
ncbi:helix-turn-helix domain-containing protein, partial [archaeon]